MKSTLFSTLKYIIGIGVGIILFYLAFRDISVSKLQTYFAQARWEWLGVSMMICIVSHFLRAQRWRMLLQATDNNIPIGVSFAAVMFNYLVNFAFPRAGEIARCTAVYQSHKIPVATGVGTVVTERLIDVLMLGLFCGLTFWFSAPFILSFFDTVEASKGEGQGFHFPVWFGILLVFFLILLIIGFIFRHFFLRIPLIQKIVLLVRQLIDSIWSIRKIKHPILFVIYSLGIWFCYWMMMYTGLFCFAPIADQSATTNLLLFSFIGTAIGSIGMALPIPGGIGPYHNALIFTFVGLKLFPEEAISREWGQTFAFAFHTAQMLVVIIGGALGYAYLLMFGRISPNTSTPNI